MITAISFAIWLLCGWIATRFIILDEDEFKWSMLFWTAFGVITYLIMCIFIIVGGREDSGAVDNFYKAHFLPRLRFPKVRIPVPSRELTSRMLFGIKVEERE